MEKAKEWGKKVRVCESGRKRGRGRRRKRVRGSEGEIERERKGEVAQGIGKKVGQGESWGH